MLPRDNYPQDGDITMYNAAILKMLTLVTQLLLLQTAVMAAATAISLGLDGAVTETTANYFAWSVK